MVDDIKWMKKALWISYWVKGTTFPNPTVGAVLIDRHGQYLGCDVTQPVGEFHAERQLLNSFSIDQTQQGTLYTTLEPCCFQGKTPPCTDIIIEKKIARVVVATEDTNPLVMGKGIEKLRSAGIQVDLGVCKQEAFQINKDFFFAIQYQRPFIFAKLALSLDGCMSTFSGHSQWITNQRLRTMAHILRYRSHAIMVGSGTVIQDNPQLTVRFQDQVRKSLYRIILDRRVRISLDTHVLSDDEPTLWVVDASQENNPSVKVVLSRKNKEIFLWKKNTTMQEFLEFLYHSKHIISLMVEGGSSLLTHLMQEKCIDACFIGFGNMFLGNGLKPFGMNINSIDTAPTLKSLKMKNISQQCFIFGDVVT